MPAAAGKDMAGCTACGGTPDLGDGDAFEGVDYEHARYEVARAVGQMGGQIVDASLPMATCTNPFSCALARGGHNEHISSTRG